MGATAISNVVRSCSTRSEHRVDVEAWMQAHRRARGGGRDEVEEPEHMRRRCRDLEAVIGGQPQRRAPVHDPRAERAVGMAHRLRQAGRSGAEDEDRVRVRPIDVQPQSLPTLVDDVAEKPGIVDVDELRRVEVRCEELASRLVVDHMSRSGEVDACKRDLGLLPCRAQRDQRTPHLQHSEECDRRTRAGSTP